MKSLGNGKILISVRSRLIRSRVASIEVPVDKRSAVIGAGACAERLCERRPRETIDPDKVAIAVESHFDEFVAQMNREAAAEGIILV